MLVSFLNWSNPQSALNNTPRLFKAGLGWLTKTTSVFLLFIAFVLLGCASKPILPLTVGNQWHHHWTHFNQSGDTSLTQENYIRVIKDTTVANEHWSMIRTSYGVVTSSESFATNRPDGLYRFFRAAVIPRHDLPYPAVVGSIAVTIDTFPSGDIGVDSVYVQSTDTLITVPAGTFHAYLYRRRSIYNSLKHPNDAQSDLTEEFYAPGVGFIKGLYYGIPEFTRKPNEEVLIEYNIK